MKNRKVPNRPSWMSRCQAMEAHLESMGFYVSYTKSGAMVQPMVPAVNQRKTPFLRRAWHRIHWLFG